MADEHIMSIKAATLLRDTLVASITGTGGEPVIAADLRLRTCVAALKPSVNQVDNALRILAREGLLERVRVFRKDAPTARYGYVAPNSDVKPRPAVATPKSIAVGLPEVKVDLLKASGRLRIEFHGLSIEIGVVE